MSKLTRRDLIKSSLATAAGAGAALALPNRAWSKALGANDDVRLAVVGLSGQEGWGQGKRLAELFGKITNVRIAALCDVDKNILNGEAQKFKDRNEKVDAYIDVRKIIDDKNIDAVVIATPNHWHALMTIWACQAGKDVYVEKPVSHNIWEGRKMVEAARQYKRIVQAGTQIRSDAGMPQIIEYLREGNLGKILCARTIFYRDRKSIGKVDGPQPVPEYIDYNLWTGPAPLVPLMRRKVHYDWHWVWDTGNGELGNNGTHRIDVCRWILGQNKLATRVISIGGRFGYIDDGQTPNSQIVFYDYKPAPLIVEIRGLPHKKNDPVFDHYRGIRRGVVIHCEGGYFAGAWAYDNDGKEIKLFKRKDGSGHHAANFINAMRSRKPTDLNAEILEGHLSTSLCHMGNISHRIGQQGSRDEIAEAIKGNSLMTDVFSRFQEYLLLNQVNLDETPRILGPWLTVDSDKERFVGEFAGQANQYLRRQYREPFVVPEQV